jgi:hypothetical protein
MTHMADKLYLNPQSTKKQYGLKAGLKLFGDQGNSAIRKELTQFHTLKCFVPKDPKTLTRDDRRNALTSLMFLTEKRSGEVKATVPRDNTLPKKKLRLPRLPQRLFSFRAL